VTARRADLVVLVVALLVRVVLVLDARDALFWGAPVADERAYVDLARALLLGHPPAHGAWYVSPGYAYVLACIFRLGGGFVAAKLVNVLAGVLGSVFVARLGSRIAGPRAGLVAGCVWALYPAALLQELLLLKTTLAVTCVLGALVAIPFDGSTRTEVKAHGGDAARGIAFWYARGLDWWRRQPLRELALTLKKLALLWGPHALSDTFSTSLAG